MNTCSFDGCNKKVVGHGLCGSHYAQKYYYKWDKLKPIKKVNWKHDKLCSFPGCKEKYWAKDLCKNHYAQKCRGTELSVLHKDRVKGKCIIDGCNNIYVSHVHKYCSNHYYRWIKYGDPLGSSNNKGTRNGQWKGGVSEYPNHYNFKKARIVVLSKANYKCEMCGLTAKYVHHKDNTKSNHELSNLMAICPKCHCALHRKGRPRLYPDSFYKEHEKIGVSLMTLLKYKTDPSSLQYNKRYKIYKYYKSIDPTIKMPI